MDPQKTSDESSVQGPYVVREEKGIDSVSLAGILPEPVAQTAS
jgi:hypothetical protein